MTHPMELIGRLVLLNGKAIGFIIGSFAPDSSTKPTLFFGRPFDYKSTDPVFYFYGEWILKESETSVEVKNLLNSWFGRYK